MGHVIPKAQLQQADHSTATESLFRPVLEARGEQVNWQDIVWREWRNSREFGWSDRTRDLLFDLVADLPISRSIVSVMTGLLTGIYGASIGWVWELIRCNWVRGRNSWWEGISLDATGVFRLPASWMSSAITGFMAGSLVGALGIVLLGRRLTWRKWLARFVPTRPAPTVADQVINVFSGGFLRGPLIALSLWGASWVIDWYVFDYFGARNPVLCGLLAAFCLACYFDLRALIEGSEWPQRYSLWCFWWRKRPQLSEVESALRLACGDEWRSILRLIDEKKADPGPLQRHVENLCSRSWKWRLVSAHALLSLGGEAAGCVAPLASHGEGSVRRLALWILKGIEKETRSRLAGNRQWLCPRCLVRAYKHRVPLNPGQLVWFHGCRACGQSETGLECAAVHAVLDNRNDWELEVDTSCARVNWLRRLILFDFDRVCIESATELEIERFVMAAGNDVDEVRRQRYKQVPCHLSRGCPLSENSLRLLKRTFGIVVGPQRTTESRGGLQAGP